MKLTREQYAALSPAERQRAIAQSSPQEMAELLGAKPVEPPPCKVVLVENPDGSLHSRPKEPRKPYNPSLIKLLILAALAVSLVVAASGIYIWRQSVYKRNFGIAEVRVGQLVSESHSLVGDVASNWSTEIEYSNDLWQEELQRDLKKPSMLALYDLLNKDAKLADDAVAKISNPPSKFANAYIKLMDCYGFGKTMQGMASSPQGSLVDYNTQSADLWSRFQESWAQENVMSPAWQDEKETGPQPVGLPE
jgi:hypothetical protein